MGKLALTMSILSSMVGLTLDPPKTTTVTSSKVTPATSTQTQTTAPTATAAAITTTAIQALNILRKFKQNRQNKNLIPPYNPNQPQPLVPT